MYCSRCGTRAVAAEAGFCSRCGAPLRTVGSPLSAEDTTVLSTWPGTVPTDEATAPVASARPRLALLVLAGLLILGGGFALGYVAVAAYLGG